MHLDLLSSNLNLTKSAQNPVSHPNGRLPEFPHHNTLTPLAARPDRWHGAGILGLWSGVDLCARCGAIDRPATSLAGVADH
jgi:hypothetical protein